MVHLNIIGGGDVFQNFRFFDFYVRVVHLAQKECGSYSEINRVVHRHLPMNKIVSKVLVYF